jgi:FtsP/CotA-like multicopper oxidase with cupredoxin domain
LNHKKCSILIGWVVFVFFLKISQGWAQTGPNPLVDYTKPNFAYSPPLRKFVDSLPGLTTAGTNNLGQYIPVATPNTNTYPGSDYYEIALVEYREQLHSDLPPVVGGKTDRLATGGTKLRGYVQEVSGVAVGEPHYLGPLILATAGRPVRIKFTNRLPIGAPGDLFLPTDTTYMGAGLGPSNTTENYTQNRATLHLHGGVNPWISDGTPHQWTVPAGETTSYKKGVSTQNVPDMGLPADGSITFYWPNEQSSRLMFYHDHVYGLTRLNVYGGEAAGYLIVDPAGTGEWTLPIPGLSNMIPLIIQDRTFVCDATTPTATNSAMYTTATDPLWDTNKWGGGGNFWFPHVYVPNQDPFAPDLSGANPMGRWDYGPWFWPPWPVTVPYPPTLSGTPEAFMDTPLVNGTAYPYVKVAPRAYRLRILNACNDRMINLQLYVADPAIYTNADGRAYTNTEVRMIPAIPGTNIPPWYPAMDARAGGIPDSTLEGPRMIQIGTEGGLLPAPVVLTNTPVGYEYNRRNIVVLNVLEHTLFMGPAERADVIVDFSKFADKTIILYNDAPAPVPAFDPRFDFYTGNPDFSITGGENYQGGSPSTLPGWGPNTRTIMQFRVDPTTPDPDYMSNQFAALQAALPKAFTNSQPAPIVKQAAYGPAYGTNYLDIYARISDNYLVTEPQPLGSVIVTAGGTNYTSAPMVIIVGGGGTNATAIASIATGRVTAITLVNPGTGYVNAPTVRIRGGGGFGAMAVAYLTNAYTMQPKAIQELFDDFGRMNATLGVELPFTSAFIQTTIPLGYIDPVTELFNDGETQIWKITHNGVDTHAIHFHLVNVQVINRVGWDGAIRPPEPNELGWKETVRMNPLEDIIVALRAVRPTLPWPLPDSIRPLAPSIPLGATMGFTGVDPQTGNPMPVSNVLTNFGWEYVWHCHLLGHEENDMMRPLVMLVAPAAPSNLIASASAKSVNPLNVTLTWANNATVPAATFITIQRATDSNFTAGVTNFTAGPTATSYTNTPVAQNITYYYRVRAENSAGYSPWSNITGPLPAAPTNVRALLIAVNYVILAWNDNSYNESGFYIERSANGGVTWTRVGQATANSTQFRHTGLTTRTTYLYRVQAVNTFGVSGFSNTLTITTR